MAKFAIDERETHINMSHGSDKMKIYTTEYNIMRKLDRYVENNDNWKVVEIGMVHGEVVSKTYEAPKDLLLLREKKRTMTEEQREAAAKRLRAYHASKNGETPDDKVDEVGFTDEDNEEEKADEDDSSSASQTDTTAGMTSAADNETPRLEPQKSQPKIVKVKSVIDEMEKSNR